MYLPLRFWVLMAFFLAVNVSAQTLLDQRISIRFQDLSLEQSLNALEEVADCSFSYNPVLLPLENRIDKNYRRTLLSEILEDLLLPLQLQYRSVGKYVIIEPAQRVAEDSPGTPTYRSAPPLAEEPLEKPSSSPSTNDDPPKPEIIVEPIESTVDERPLEVAVPNSIEEVFLVKLLINDDVLQNPYPRHQLETNWAQVTLISPIGTKLWRSGRYNNIFSLNLLAGYSGGVQGVEVGGILNVVRYEVKGVQIGGVGNVVGGRTYGTQIAGMTNINRGSVTGLQIAGMINWADTLHYGMQTAGFVNVLTGEGNGLQIGGFGNVGIRTVSGLQIGGFGNWARIVKGWQFAGFLNYGGEVNGGQASAFLNTAKQVKGVQLAPFNFCDSIQGVPIGFFSYVRKGYHRWVVSGSETLPLSISYKTGNARLFNIFTAGWGIHWDSGPRQRVSVGYGLGTQFPLVKRHRMQLEWTTSQVWEQEMTEAVLNLLNELHLGWNAPLGKRLRIQAGPTAYLHISDWQDEETLDYYSELAPRVIHEWTGDFGSRYQWWMGGRVSIGF